MNLEDTMLREISQTLGSIPCSKKQKVEQLFPGAGGGGNKKLRFNEHRISV